MRYYSVTVRVVDSLCDPDASNVMLSFFKTGFDAKHEVCACRRDSVAIELSLGDDSVFYFFH